MMRIPTRLAQSLGILRTRPGVVAVQVMRSWAALPVRERGQNRGRWVDAIVALGGGNPTAGSAWCAYACWAAWHTACASLGLRLDSPTSGGVVQSWILQADTPAQIHIDDVRSGSVVLQPGDLFIRTRDAADAERAKRGSRVLGHTELVVSVGPDGWLHTVGGNTTGGDSREGDGVYDKPRGIHLGDDRLVGFVRPAVSILVRS